MRVKLLADYGHLNKAYTVGSILPARILHEQGKESVVIPATLEPGRPADHWVNFLGIFSLLANTYEVIP